MFFSELDKALWEFSKPSYRVYRDNMLSLMESFNRIEKIFQDKEDELIEGQFITPEMIAQAECQAEHSNVLDDFLKRFKIKEGCDMN